MCVFLKELGSRDALIIVDYQVDFCPGGALPVSGGDELAPFLNRYISIFADSGSMIVATRDYHPPDHMSFRDHGGTWPSHCVGGTTGAGFHPGLSLPKGTLVISKAIERYREAYSGFDGTKLADNLRERGIERVFVGGLATDYCVKNTVLDAIGYGFHTVLLTDAIRSVDVEPGDGEKALREMVEAGAKTSTFDELANPVSS